MAQHYQYEKRIAERKLRGRFCKNWWNALRMRVIGCKENRKAVHFKRREAQQGIKCWGCGKMGYCLWVCPNKAICPTKGEAQQRKVRRVEAKEEVVKRK